MKKIKDFGVDYVAKIFDITNRMVTNPKVTEARIKTPRIFTIFNAMLQNEPDATMELLAILNDMTLAEYKRKKNAADIMLDIKDLYDDDDIMALFELRARKTENASSTPATETIEAAGQETE